MKYNEKELAALACEGGSDKEGLLYKKGGQKGQSYQPRWFRLKGNLLFYFKANEKGVMTSSEPQGALVLEGCKVEQFEHPLRRHCFSVGFEEDDASRVYYLSCQTADEVASWMDAIKKASYEYMRSRLHELQQRIITLTGKDPLAAVKDDFQPEFSPKIKRSTVARTMHRNSAFVASKAITSCDEPSVEMSVACLNLPMTSTGEGPSTYVHIRSRMAPKAAWMSHSRTEIIEDCSDPAYFASIMIRTGDCTSNSTRLKFSVYDVKNREGEKPLLIGEAECVVGSVVSTNEASGPVTFDLRREGFAYAQGQVVIAAFQTETTIRKHSAVDVDGDSLMPVMDRIIFVKYRLPTRSKDTLKVVEEMGESLFALQVPFAYLKMLNKVEHQGTKDLYELGELNNQWEKVRQEILRGHFMMLGHCQGAMSDLQKLDVSCFKSSRAKRDKELEFMAINLHVQRLKVIRDSGRPELAYQCITFGAPAAHHQGFKQGGLKRMLADLRTSPSFVAGRDSPGVTVNNLLAKVEDVRKSLSEMSKQIYSSAANYATSSISSATTQISNKVQTLMQICQSELVKSALVDLKSALNRSSNSGVVDSQSSDWVWNGMEYVQISSQWSLDVTREQLITQLGNLVQVSDEVSAQIEEDTARRSSSVWHQSTTGHLIVASPRLHRSSMSVKKAVASRVSSVLQNVTQVNYWSQQLMPVVRSIVRTADGLCQMVKQSLRLYMLGLDAAIPSSQLQAIKLRKDIVMSQSLTALVTAFHCMLSSKVHNKVFCQQLAEVGFLAFFECLLNTQGDEKGMLEDMYVAVQELVNVSFKLVASTPDDDQVVMTGTRAAIVIELPLPRLLFEMLPMPLQWGSPISVIPVLLSQAVIPQQLTDVTSVGSSSLQDEINSEGLSVLLQYFEDYRKALGGTSAHVSLEIPALAEMIGRLQASFQTQKSKNVDFLNRAEQVCQRINGARLTSCKSAKDRTGMAVTYEMCLMLGSQYDLHPDNFQQVLNAVRSRGTRLENCYKNLGVRKYNFSSLQLKCAPKQYCPPEGSYGKAKDKT